MNLQAAAQGRGPHTGAPCLPPAELGSRRFFIPHGESTASPTAAGPMGRPGRAGSAGQGLKGGVGFIFKEHNWAEEGYFFPTGEKKGGGESGEIQHIYLSTARQDKEVLTTV